MILNGEANNLVCAVAAQISQMNADYDADAPSTQLVGLIAVLAHHRASSKKWNDAINTLTELYDELVRKNKACEVSPQETSE